MDASRCPECENDLTETTTSTIVNLLKTGKIGVAAMTCPHCGTELSVDARVTATITRQR